MRKFLSYGLLLLAFVFLTSVRTDARQIDKKIVVKECTVSSDVVSINHAIMTDALAVTADNPCADSTYLTTNAEIKTVAGVNLFINSRFRSWEKRATYLYTDYRKVTAISETKIRSYKNPPGYNRVRLVYNT